MSFLGRIITFFTPAIYLLTIIGCIYFHSISLWASFAWLVGMLYLAPLLCFRIHDHFFPLKKSKSFLDTPGYSPWWGSFQIQKIYYDLPFLESILRSSFLYSSWLRCWGSKIGNNVQFTPNIEIIDRSLVDIGDNVIFGHRVILGSHIVVPVKDRQCLFLGPVTIGKNAFLGAGTVIGPNCTVPEGSFVAPETRLALNQVYKSA